MRHIALYLGIAAALAASCATQEKDFQVPETDGTRLYATFEQPDGEGTKVYVNEDLQLRWTADDRVSVFNKNTTNQQFRFLGATGDSEGEFEAVGSGSAGSLANVVAVYPYQEAALTESGVLTVTLPAEQAYAAHSFGPGANTMVSVTSDDVLQFKNAGGYLKLSLYGAGVQVSSITLKGNKGEKIAGKASVSMPLGGVPAVTMAADATTEITVTCAEPVALGATAAESVDFWFVVPPVTFSEGFTVTVTHQGGAFEKSTGKSVAITRNHLSKMAPVEVAATTIQPGVFRISHLWLWGGTAPQWGGTKVFDLLTKPDYFNREDGRGVTALADNYYEIKPDGTFINHAGEDGRNWWFVYSGSVNPENHKDLDLRKFYDVLPLAQGQCAIDGSTVTFTRTDNTATQATLVGPGTYDMLNTNPVKSVTITTQALMFTITGGTESWDQSIMYTDYHAIAGNPKLLFVELERMPDGFVVPDASKTTDADFKYEPAFDLTDLPGNWKVYGGSVSVGNDVKPYGLWVVGGSGGNPAFVSPIDKNWCWDGSVKWEVDNCLSINATSMNGTEVRGTTNWTAGADGKFWNYLFNTTVAAWSDYYGTDLSKYYDQIPKGESAFTLDIASMTATLGNGHQARLITPGSYSFTNATNNPLVIPAGCFALVFHLMDSPVPVVDETLRYKDIDRFLFAPIEYIIIFQKVQ